MGADSPPVEFGAEVSEDGGGHGATDHLYRPQTGRVTRGCESKGIRGRCDSDATEGVQLETVGIRSDDPVSTTADRQLEYLVVLRIATGPS